MPWKLRQKPVRKPRPKCVLSPESEAIIDKVIALLSIPENSMFYQQSTFIEPSDFNECQTECCLAGWTIFASSPRRYRKLEKIFKTNSSYAIDQIAVLAPKLLTLANGKLASTQNLFTGSGTKWPGSLGWRWMEASDGYFPLEAARRMVKAKIAVDRLKYFKRFGR